MKRTIRLTESDLIRLIKRVISEHPVDTPTCTEMISCLRRKGIGMERIPHTCITSADSPSDPTKCKSDIQSKFKGTGIDISSCLVSRTPGQNPNVMN